MTAAGRLDHSSILLVQLLLLLAVCYRPAQGQTFNFSLMPTSCDWGLVENVDDISIIGDVDMRGLANDQTLYSLQVDSTSDNQTFTFVCKAIFKSSDCTDNTAEGCYCKQANDGGQQLQLYVKQRATEKTNCTYYRLSFKWTNSGHEQLIFVRIPHIYGEATSSLIVHNTTYSLSTQYGCPVSGKTLSGDAHILFCTKNLKSPVLTVAFAEDDIKYYVNQECAPYFIQQRQNSSGLAFRFTYTDSCNRSQAFECSVGESTATGEPILHVRNSTGLILLGTVMSMVFFVGVIYNFCKDGHEGIDDHEDYRRRRGIRRRAIRQQQEPEPSSVDTSSGVESSRSVHFTVPGEDDSQVKERRASSSDIGKLDMISSSSAI